MKHHKNSADEVIEGLSDQLPNPLITHSEERPGSILEKKELHTDVTEYHVSKN
jgi:hypothetical protein